MNNFYNAIGVADMEKVHSAMIAWILDDRNDQMLHSTSSANSQFTTFSLPIRSEFLCELFQVKPIKQFKSIQTQIEWNNIDIIVETEDRNGNKEIWVIISVPLKFGIMFLSIWGAIKALKSMLFICKWLILKMDDHSNRRALFLLIRY